MQIESVKIRLSNELRQIIADCWNEQTCRLLDEVKDTKPNDKNAYDKRMLIAEFDKLAYTLGIISEEQQTESYKRLFNL